MGKKNVLRTISCLMVVVLLFSMLPVSTLAAQSEAAETTSIKATVVTVEGDVKTPVAGATISVDEKVYTTDEYGETELTDLVVGEAYEAAVTCEGYEDAVQPITVEENGEVEIVLTAYVYTEVVFVVTDKDNAAVQGAEVTVGTASGTSDENGEVKLADLIVGHEYTAVATCEGFAPAEQSFTAAENGKCEISLNAYISASVTVRDAQNNPVANASVTAGDQTVTTDDEGKAELINLEEGKEYQIVVTCDGYAPAELTVIAGETERMPVTLDAYTTVTVTVCDIYNTPIAGAAVATDAETVTTDDNGEATLSKVVAGDVITISASCEGYASNSRENYTVRENGDVKIRLTPYTVVTVSGTVHCENAPVEGVTVTLAYGDGTLTAETDANGAYAFADVYQELVGQVTVSAEGYETVSEAVDFFNGNAITIKKNQYTVTVVILEGEGTYYVQPDTITHGDDVTITIEAEEGYCIYGIIGNNKEQVGKDASGEVEYDYQINNVTEDHTIQVIFVEDAEELHFFVDGNGALWQEVEDTEPVEYKKVAVWSFVGLSVEKNEETGEITLSYTPAKNFRVESVTIDGEKTDYTENDQAYPGEDAEDTFWLDTEEEEMREYIIRVVRNQFNITVNDDTAVVSPEDMTVDYDRTAKFTFTPGEGKYVSSLTVNGKDVTNAVEYDGENAVYKLTEVKEDKHVEVTYAEIAESADHVVSVTQNEVVKEDGTTYYLSNLTDEASVTFSVEDAKISRSAAGPFVDSIEIKETDEIDGLFVLDGTVIYSVAYSAKVVKDVTAPKITQIDEVKSYKYYGPVKKIDKLTKYVTASDDADGSGIDRVVYSTTEYDVNKDADTIRGLPAATLNANGEYEVTFTERLKATYYFWAIDEAGNISAPKSEHIDTDDTVPVIESFRVSNMVSYLNGNYGKPGDVTFMVECHDDLSDIAEVVLTIGDKTYVMTGPENSKAGTYTVTVSEPASGEVSVSVRDAAANAVDEETGVVGNVATATLQDMNSQLSSNYLTVEATAPQIVINSISSENYFYDETIENPVNWYGAGGVLFTITITDEVAGLDLDSIEVNGGYEVVEGSVVKETMTQIQEVEETAEDGTVTVVEKEVEVETGKITEVKLTVVRTGEVGKNTEYDIVISAKDVVGNAAQLTSEDKPGLKFTMDLEAPTVAKFDISGTIGVEEGAGDKEHAGSAEVGVIATDYGYHFQKDTVVTVWAEDVGAGVSEITFYTISSEGEKSVEITEAVEYTAEGQAYAKFDVAGGFKGQVYAYVKDKVNNVGETAQPTQMTTVESQEDHNASGGVEVENSDGTTANKHVVFAVTESVGTDEGGVDIYTMLQYTTDENGNKVLATDENGEQIILDSIPVEIRVVDTFNGISAIRYTIKYPGKEDVTVELTRKENNGEVVWTGGDSDWTVATKDSNLDTEVTGVINLTEEGNAIEVEIRMWDNAGNTSTETIALTIDNTLPTFEVFHIEPDEIDEEDEEAVAFRENNPTEGTVQDSIGMTPYFIGFSATEYRYQDLAAEYPLYAGGTLQIKVYERNITQEELIASGMTAVKALEGRNLDTVTENNISNTIRVFGPFYDRVDELTQETERCEAVYPFEQTEEVYYILELRNCSEEADGGTYVVDVAIADRAGHSAEVTEFFVIDEIAPAISIDFDNDDVRNEMYYNAERTATITVVERNFNNESGQITGIASDDGTAFAFPTLGGWTDSADMTVHTATVTFSADGLYRDFEASYTDLGNQTGTATADDFVVDTTAPEILITGVEDLSANNGEVAPVITYTDTNIDLETLELVLTGANCGIAEYDKEISDIRNGQTYAYVDFKYEKSVDDIYTLYVYIEDLAGNPQTKTITFSCNRFGSVFDLSEIEDMLGQYNQQERTIVITETNVDPINLEDVRITLTKNGNPVDLVQGVDYTVTQVGGEGTWSQYTYVISAELFADDGTYSIYIYTMDKAGNINENIDEVKDAQISFGIDKTLPIINPVDFESDAQYPEEGKDVSIEIKDNLLLADVRIFLNGEEIEYSVDGEMYTFHIPMSNAKQSVRILAVDSAGNEQEVLVKDFLVTTNIFARWYNNTPLFIGSLVVLAALAGIGGWRLFLILFKKKRDDEEENA